MKELTELTQKEQQAVMDIVKNIGLLTELEHGETYEFNLIFKMAEDEEMIAVYVESLDLDKLEEEVID